FSPQLHFSLFSHYSSHTLFLQWVLTGPDESEKRGPLQKDHKDRNPLKIKKHPARADLQSPALLVKMFIKKVQ
ncbi:MAG: hypothetical protein PHW56_09025, partial [Methanosarcinaceae archaeon]|nr:hypothetical protein [Methanosarcinaceae archaeon]